MIQFETKPLLGSPKTYDFGRLKAYGVRWAHNGARLTTRKRYEEDCRMHAKQHRRVQLLPRDYHSDRPGWLALFITTEDGIKLLK